MQIMNFLDELNPAQRAAVEYNEGPSLVIAGAGSGKTRVLTYKVAYLLQQGVNAANILALTFTNKAAREMKERITRLVSPEAAHYLWMGTFHSICARILKQEAALLGYTRDFTIYDTTDTKSLIKQLIKERGLDEKTYKPNVVLNRISEAKNHLLSDEEYAISRECRKRDMNDQLTEVANLYHLYQLRLKAANAMDFDDLLVNLCLLFRNHPDRLEVYQSYFHYILVDEYQDTNYVQYLLVKMLAEPQNKVCVVGDDAQSIYSFRGADIRNILTFQNGYTNARLFKLERNYRSTQTIVKAANSLIHHNENQIYKEVYSEKEQGERIELTSYLSDREEASGVAQRIKSIPRRQAEVTWDDIAVLYRTNAQSRALENELRKLNIPYRIYGGMSFYQRKEIKDTIGYFRLAVNSKDNEALLRIINLPARGIGDTTIRKISETAIQLNVSMNDVIMHPREMALDVNSGILKRLGDFATLMSECTEAANTMDAYEYAAFVLRRSGILAAAAMDTTPEGIDRKENLDELLNGIHAFVQQRQEEGVDFTPIHDFLAEVSLLTDQDEHTEDHTPRVTLMTVHAAKGLEFPHVFIVGMEENLFPSQFCTSPREIEEERRLLYVAITRAMQRCYMTYARQRFRNGATSFSSPSRFLKDIDRQYVCELSGFSGFSKFSGAESLRRQNPFGAEAESRRWQNPFGSEPTKLVKPVHSPSSILNSPFMKGDRVMHRVFGKGTVLAVYNENDNDKIDILFDGPGKKTLLLTYAKLEKTV